MAAQAIVALVAALIPHVGTVIEGLIKMVKSIKAVPETPEGLKAQLDMLDANLTATQSVVKSFRF